MNRINLTVACFLVSLFAFGSNQIFAQKKDKTTNAPKTINTPGISFRSVGPALTSGRLIDLSVHPKDPNTWYLAAASGGVWKTMNHGISFDPIFDGYGSYSIGCLAMAQSNPNVIWVGTGENNNQRSVAYGDGVYKSEDGGNSFKNMGLKESQHIGKIIIHPQDENTLWVAAYGPVWNAGGDRGVYKSMDGGKTWERTLFISDETGIAEIAIDPSNPNTLYASAHQRRRHEWTYIGGGPESNLYKSIDGGKTWFEINNGLPKAEMGRLGIAVSSVDPNLVYVIVEARGDKGGIFKSSDKGASFNKMSGYNTSGNYYQEIYCDPTDKDKIFIMDTWLHHSTDGGKTVVGTGEELKHVDNHCIWVDPINPKHWLVGCDGGLYETYTAAQSWRYYDNLPITQFYKVATDNALPFYNIYGGTQDNNSMGGPSATKNVDGIANSDWFITWGGDGFESAIDPTNANIAYSQSQYGGLVRYNKLNGEKNYIQPQPGKGEAAYRWNWDAPMLISPHNNNRLYFGANKLFKSDNQGNDWQTISPDLTQQIDRNKLKVMGQVWSIDAVMKNQSTTIYGNVIALDESPKKEGLIYVGTDDGLIQVTDNGGSSWSKYQRFTGVPANTRVNMLTASLHQENVVFAAFVNQRAGDFKPYLLKSSDKGKTWNSIAGNLPIRGSVYCIKQDHINENLLFVGTEFGAYYTTDSGVNWTKLNGLPTIAVYDLDIQKRESDLVAATFGRGFYVIDNYSALRNLQPENLSKKAYLFPIKNAKLYNPASSNGLAGTGSQGHNFWTAQNPKFGAIFTIHLKDEFKTLKSIRTENELKDEKDKKDVFYPSWDELRKEKNEEAAQLIWIIKTKEGVEVKRFKSAPTSGVSNVVWNLRMESSSPVNPNKPKHGRYESADDGLMVVSGKYTIEVLLVQTNNIETLIPATNFEIEDLEGNGNKHDANDELISFKKEVSELKRSIAGAAQIIGENQEKLELLKFAVTAFPNVNISLIKEIQNTKLNMDSCSIMLYGDGLKSSKEFETPPTFLNRANLVYYNLFETNSAVTQTQRDYLKWAQEEYAQFRVKFNSSIIQMKAIEAQLEAANIPYIKGKDEKWKKN